MILVFALHADYDFPEMVYVMEGEVQQPVLKPDSPYCFIVIFLRFI